MGKGSFIAIVALLVAVAGAIVAFAAYFRRRGCSLCDDMDEGDADLDYYATHIEEDSDEAEEETSEPEQQEEAVAEEAPVEESEKSEDIPE